MFTSRLLPIILILLSIGLVVLYVVPTYNTQIKSERAQISNYDAALQAAQSFTQKENQLIAEKNAIPASSLSRLQAFLPDGVDNVQLILDINQLASRSGISLSDFKIAGGPSSNGPATGNSAGTSNTSSSPTPIQAVAGAGKASGLTNSLTLSVDAAGTYGSFRTFLSGIEQSLRPLDITQLTLSPSATGAYKYQITFQIYWLQ